MLYDKLSVQDKDTFISYILAHGSNYDSALFYPNNIASAETLLTPWAEKKETLFKLFGEKFILEREIEYDAPRSLLTRQVTESLENGKMFSFYNQVFTYALNKWGRWSDETCNIECLFGSWSLVDNSHKHLTRMELEFENGQKVKIDPETKLMKMLGRIAKAIGGVTENLFEDFRLEHSRILNQKKLKGTLCLSIHPMDYITISDNANNWSSCMSWMEDGDYRMGTVEMLNSPNVVVAYLKSDTRDFTWGSNSWNSKMWRTLLIVDPKLLISVKSYPFENADLTKEALEWVRQLANDNVDWSFPYPCEELHESSDNEWRGDFYHIVCNCGAMYNDFGAMTHYGSIATDAPSRIDIWYSGPSECMWCGQLDPDIYEKSYVFGSCCCEDEGSNYHCDECGCRISEDYTYWVEDIAICESCYERLTAWDDFQDEAIFKDNAVEVYLCKENDNPMEEQDYSLTIHERYLESHHYQPHNYYSKFFTCSPHYNEESHLWYWNVADATAEGLWAFFGVKDPDAYIADK